MNSKHSGLGIASFITSITTGVLMFSLFVIAGFLEASTPGGMNEDSPAALIVGLCMFALLFFTLVAFGMGIAGVLQSDRNKVFAILGIIFSTCVGLGTIGLVALGLMMEQ